VILPKMFEIELANGRITVSVLAFVHSGSSGDADRRYQQVTSTDDDGACGDSYRPRSDDRGKLREWVH